MEVVKRTPKGAWVKYFGNPSGQKFVLLTAKKQYASNTRDEALNQLYHRKLAHRRILKAKLSDVNTVIMQVKFKRSALALEEYKKAQSGK